MARGRSIGVTTGAPIGSRHGSSSAALRFVLIEGVYSTRTELRDLLDVAIFIDTPRDERLRRMLARPQDSTAWIDRWMAAEDWYLENIASQHHADLVIEGF